MTWLAILAAYLGSSVIGSWLVVGFFRAGAQSDERTHTRQQFPRMSEPLEGRIVGGNRVQHEE